MTKPRLFSLIAGSLLLAFFAGTLCLGQTPAPVTRSSVTILHVKPDMLNEWFDLEKNEVIPAFKKAGVASVTVLRTVWGSGLEFVIITPLDKYADRDAPNPLLKALGPEASARLFGKLLRCVSSAQSFVSTRMDDLSNIPAGAPPPIGVSTRVRVAPGKGQEWANFVKADILPVYKKANARFQVSSRGFGANPNDRTISTYAATFAELDAGSLLIRTLGAEGVAKVMAKGTGLGTVVETLVRQRVADLSY